MEPIDGPMAEALEAVLKLARAYAQWFCAREGILCAGMEVPVNGMRFKVVAQHDACPGYYTVCELPTANAPDDGVLLQSAVLYYRPSEKWGNNILNADPSAVLEGLRDSGKLREFVTDMPEALEWFTKIGEAHQ